MDDLNRVLISFCTSQVNAVGGGGGGGVLNPHRELALCTFASTLLDIVAYPEMSGQKSE